MSKDHFLDKNPRTLTGSKTTSEGKATPRVYSTPKVDLEPLFSAILSVSQSTKDSLQQASQSLEEQYEASIKDGSIDVSTINGELIVRANNRKGFEIILKTLTKTNKLDSVTSLDLGDYSPHHQELSKFARNKILLQLKTLSLSTTVRVETITMLQCANFPNLTHLDLKNCYIGSEGAKAIAKNSNFQNLTSLDLSCNYIGPEGAKAITESSNFRNLTSLDLGNNDIGPEGAKAIAESSNFQNLTSLDLGSNDIGPEGAKAIAKSTNLQGLTSLDLSYNKIGPTGAEAIAKSTKLQGLMSLKLRSTEIGSDGAKAIAATNSRKLTTLDLTANNIGPTGAEAIAESTNLQSLQKLYMWDCKIKRTNAQSIIDSKNLPNLIDFGNDFKIDRDLNTKRG